MSNQRLQNLKDIIGAQQEALTSATPAPKAPAPASLIPPEGIAIEVPEEQIIAPAAKPNLVQPHPVLAAPEGVRQNITKNVLNAQVSFDSLTQEQKDIFLMAVLHGEPVVWDIALLEGRMVVTVRTIHEILLDDLVSAWLQNLEEKGITKTVANWATWMQRAHVFLRVVKVQREGKLAEVSDTSAIDAMLEEIRETGTVTVTMVEALDVFVRKCIRRVSHTDFFLLTRAVALHENMHVACLDNAITGSFSVPGDTN